MPGQTALDTLPEDAFEDTFEDAVEACLDVARVAARIDFAKQEISPPFPVAELVQQWAFNRAYSEEYSRLQGMKALNDLGLI